MILLRLFLFNAALAFSASAQTEPVPNDKESWMALASEFFQDGEEGKALETMKVMYALGLLTEEKEIMRLASLYVEAGVPLQAAKLLEKEMVSGRMSQNLKNLRLLATILETARDKEKALEVRKKIAATGSGGLVQYELGISFAALDHWAEAEGSFRSAVNIGGLDPEIESKAWMYIGISQLNRGDTKSAIEALRKSDSNVANVLLDRLVPHESRSRSIDAQQTLIEATGEMERCRRINDHHSPKHPPQHPAHSSQ